ncbi:unnamed protein product [Pylaiella littoralis]
MKSCAPAALSLALFCSYAGALVPGAKFVFGVSRQAMAVRRRVGERIASSSLEESLGTAGGSSAAAGTGSLFWKRSFSKNDDKNDLSGGSPRPSATTSSVIHLGMLRIPDSRRLDLAGTREGNADSASTAVVEEAQDHADPLVEDGSSGGGAPLGEGEEEGEERGEGRVIDIAGNRVVLPPAFVGGPSVIPFGVGEGRLESGVVQVPLHHTVADTVDFIRTIATVDRDYRRGTPQPVEGEGCPEEAPEETLGSTLSSRIYVTENGTLKGYITMAALLTHQPKTPVADLLRELEEVLKEGDSWEDAAHRLRQAKAMAAPVVDGDGVLIAVLNPSDLLQEMEIEATDDIMRQSGSGGGESYFGTPLPSLVASRVGWLVSLLCLQSFSSLILQSFQDVIERNIVIALFLTMLTGTAGNAGNQSSAIVIRGLATGEIHQGNRGRVVWREARAAVASACVLSVASFVRVLLTPGATTVATLAVAIAMGATVIGAVMFGTIAPIVLHGMGVDPVNFASPALATLTDVSGVFILCSVAKLMLRN